MTTQLEEINAISVQIPGSRVIIWGVYRVIFVPSSFGNSNEGDYIDELSIKFNLKNKFDIKLCGWLLHRDWKTRDLV